MLDQNIIAAPTENQFTPPPTLTTVDPAQNPVQDSRAEKTLRGAAEKMADAAREFMAADDLDSMKKCHDLLYVALEIIESSRARRSSPSPQAGAQSATKTTPRPRLEHKKATTPTTRTGA